MNTKLRIRSRLVVVLALQVASTHVVGEQNGSAAIPESQIGHERESKMEGQEDGLLYTGVHHEELFKRIGFLYDERVIGERGVGYIMHKPPKEIYDISIGVYHTVENARLSFSKAASHLSLRPQTEENTIGSEFVMTGIGRTSGAIIVRERNICISFGWMGETEATKKTTNKILGIIQEDRTVAPMGAFPNPVKLKNAKARIAKKVNSDGLFAIPAEFTEGTDSDALLLGASSRTERFYAVSRDVGGGSILIDLRGKSRPDQFDLYMATENNVVTCETITLEATEDDP